MQKGLNVAILGATGAVGREFLDLFDRRDFPVAGLKLLASPRSAGSVIDWRDQAHTVEAVSASAFEGVDVAFFSAGASRSKEWAPAAIAAGAVVVDNSSAFRMDPTVPLVVPEINFHAIGANDRLIANPNCSAIILLMAVAPLRALGKIDRLVVSTYQSASGGGAAMMDDLLDQTRQYLASQTVEPKVTPHPYAFNLFSHNTPIGEDGANEEESKVVAESRKILEDPGLKINVTCVRVPVLRAHCESVTVEFAGAAPTEAQVRQTLAQSPGVQVVDEREANRFPMPVESSGAFDVLVGRIRRDPSHPSAMCLFVSGDQLLKGAALNALQIAERMFGVGPGSGKHAETAVV